jgi:hypothetical protein
LCPITLSLEAIIAFEIAEEAMAAEEAAMAEEEATVEEAMVEEAMVEEAMVEEEAVPEAPKTLVVRRSAYASTCAHLTLGSLCTVRRGYPCGSKQT